MIFRHYTILFFASLLLLCSGCVTTTTGGVEAKFDEEKAFNTRIQLVMSYIYQGNRDQARVNLNRAKALNDTDPRVNNAAAMLFQLEGELPLAEEQFKIALRKKPEFSSARNNYGVFLLSQGRTEEALAQFQSAADDLDYDRREVAMVNLARAAQALGLEAKAKANLEQAVLLDPNSVPALMELAEMEFDLHNYAKAKAYLDRAESLSKPGPRSLWLGIRLERIFGNKDKESSLALVLKNLYPYSNEYLEYKQLQDQQP